MEEMKCGVLGHFFALGRLNWAGDTVQDVLMIVTGNQAAMQKGKLEVKEEGTNGIINKFQFV